MRRPFFSHLSPEEAMEDPEIGKEKGVEEARRVAEEAEFGARAPTGFTKQVICGVAALWSLFQLALPKLILLPSVYIRAIHLAFAIFLVYLSYPAFKRIRLRGPLSFLSSRERVHLIDWSLAILAALAALYLAIDYEGLSARQGSPLLRDIVFGGLLVILLLEAARRSLGPALSLVAGLFIVYAFFGPYMPELIAHKGVSLGRFMGQMTMSTEGIYGIPLDVSATIVFLFVLFGAMLDRAGGGRYFVQLALSLMGRYKGGPAKAAVLASGMTGLISGSSIANTVTTGTFTIPLMKSVGYPPKKAAAVEVAASTNGQLMPPIMGAAAFIIAEYCNIPYIGVVKAAFIPAIISYIALIYITHLEASKLGLKGLSKARVPQFLKILPQGLHFLLPLAFLVYQLMIMRRSPELAAFYAICSLVALMFVKHPIEAARRGDSIWHGLKEAARLLWESLVAGGRNMMGIGVAVSAAGIVVGVVTMGLGGMIAEVIDYISGGNIIVLLVVTAIASLILGMGLPTTANYIVMASLTAPVIVEVGSAYGLVVPLIAAHLFCFFFGILADDTPPVGLAAYAASAIAKSDPIPTGVQGFLYDIRTAILPFMFIFNTDLLLVNVHSFWHAALVFITGVVGMLAFAALTQRWLITRTKIYEMALLALVTLIMLRPDLFISKFQFGNKFVWYLIGFTLYGFIFLLQHIRVRITTEA